MGATISPSLQSNLDRYIRRVTGKKSWRLFLWQGFVLTLLSGLPGILATFLRGKLYRRVLGGLGHGCLFEKDVRLYVPRRVFLGNRVMIGEGTLLDACCDEGSIELGDDAWVSRGCILVSGSANTRSRKYRNARSWAPGGVLIQSMNWLAKTSIRTTNTTVTTKASGNSR